jgi:hypothetical protein
MSYIHLVGLDQALLLRVHRADADLVHLRRGDRRCAAAQVGQRLRAEAAQAGHRHAVDVARRGDIAGVEVRVRIQPQHAQGLALLAAPARDGGDRTDAQAVVAAEHDRHAAGLQFGVAGFHQCVVPRHHFIQVAVAFHRRGPRVARAIQVAHVAHVHTARFQRLRQAATRSASGPSRAPRWPAPTSVGTPIRDTEMGWAMGASCGGKKKHSLARAV